MGAIDIFAVTIALKKENYPAHIEVRLALAGEQ